MPPELDYRHPGISSDTHDTNNLDVALRGAVRSNSPPGIRHVIMHVGVLVEYLIDFINRSADAIHKMSRASGIGQIPGGYIMHPITIARPL